MDSWVPVPADLEVAVRVAAELQELDFREEVVPGFPVDGEPSRQVLRSPSVLRYRRGRRKWCATRGKECSIFAE